MSLDSIMQVLWGGEISSLALIVTLLPLICQSLGDRYYLGENLRKYILDNEVVLKKILIVSLLLNLIVLGLVLVPVLINDFGKLKNVFLIASIVLLVVFFVYLFHKTYVVIKYLNDDEEIKKQIENNKINELKSINPTKKYADVTEKWFKCSCQDYFDAKDTIRFISKQVVSNKEPNYKLNNTLSSYFRLILKSGRINSEEITNLLIEWNNICNKDYYSKDGDKQRVNVSKLIVIGLDKTNLEIILSKHHNHIARLNELDFQKLLITLIYSWHFLSVFDYDKNIPNKKEAIEKFKQSLNNIQKDTTLLSYPNLIQINYHAQNCNE